MKRRDFQYRMNLVMTQVVKASGIARQHFRVDLVGDRERLSAVRIAVGEHQHEYDLSGESQEWATRVVDDAKAGRFGEPRSSWEPSGERYPTEVHVFDAQTLKPAFDRAG